MASVTGHLFAITGAASGIGRATTELLAQSGALLSLADKDGEAVQRLAKTLTENGASVYWKQVDVRNQDEVEAWVTCTVQHFNRSLDGECIWGQGEDIDVMFEILENKDSNMSQAP
jgi:NADP-dependent 3-hydroxy acid dehydrogenase YdfG